MATSNLRPGLSWFHRRSNDNAVIDRELRPRHLGMGAPRKGQGGSPDPLDFDINFSHIITVAPRVEIQMHFWKGAKFAGSVDIQ